MEQEKKKSKLKIIIPIIVIVVIAIIGVMFTNKTKDTEKQSTKGLQTSKYVDLKGIYVDKSDQAEHPNEALLYVLYTVKSDDKNIKFYTYLANNPGTALTIKINNTNEYKDTIYASLDQNFRNTGYENLNNGQEVLSGTSMQCIGAFRVAQNDLKQGNIIELTLNGTNSFKEVFEYKTDDVQYFDNAEEILKNADYETYEKAQNIEKERLAEVDQNLKSQIKAVLQENYYYWYISTIRMQIEFNGDRFNITSAIGTSSIGNSGTYEIRNKVLLLHYDNGTTNEFEYEFKNGEVSFLGNPQ